MKRRLKASAPFMVLTHVILACMVTSCGYSGGEIAAIVSERDSLQRLTQAQQRSLNSLDTLVSVINNGIDSVSMEEGMIFVSNEENGTPMKEDIIRKVDRLKDRLRAQRQRIERLEADLRKQAEEDQENVSLKVLLASVRERLVQKDKEINDLRAQLEAKDVDIANLQTRIGLQTQTIAELNRRNTMQTEALTRQDAMLNQCYMVVGDKKLLEQKGIIRKGKLVTRSAFDRSKFTKVDIRKFSEISFPAKKPKILTTMPQDSYTLTTDGKNNFTLIVTDPTSFWSASNYLVIQTN